MKLNIIDEYLKENIKTHKSDVFYEGSLAFWEDEKGRKLLLTACGDVDITLDIEKSIEDKIDIPWLKELHEENKEQDEEDKTTHYVIEDQEQARVVFVNGDDDYCKLIDYLEFHNNNWCEVSCILPNKKELMTDMFERDNIMAIEEFMNLTKNQVIEWLDWFEKESNDGLSV